MPSCLPYLLPMHFYSLCPFFPSSSLIKDLKVVIFNWAFSPLSRAEGRQTPEVVLRIRYWTEIVDLRLKSRSVKKNGEVGSQREGMRWMKKPLCHQGLMGACKCYAFRKTKGRLWWHSIVAADTTLTLIKLAVCRLKCHFVTYGTLKMHSSAHSLPIWLLYVWLYEHGLFSILLLLGN